MTFYQVNKTDRYSFLLWNGVAIHYAKEYVPVLLITFEEKNKIRQILFFLLFDVFFLTFDDDWRNFNDADDDVDRDAIWGRRSIFEVDESSRSRVRSGLRSFRKKVANSGCFHMVKISLLIFLELSLSSSILFIIYLLSLTKTFNKDVDR